MTGTNKIKKPIQYPDAVSFMRNGQTLARMHEVGGGVAWYLITAGPVTAKIAEALLQRPDVQPNFHSRIFAENIYVETTR